MTTSTAPAVLTALNAIQAELAKTGISKDQRNKQQGFNYRGIDDVYASLSSLLARYGVLIVPRVLGRSCEERRSNSGGLLIYSVVDVEYTIYSTVDGSSISARISGEAMDSGDKSTNKAMSSAYKYLALQLLCIPTEGDNDADATTHSVAQKTQPAQPKAAPPEETPEKAGPTVIAESRLISEEQYKELLSALSNASIPEQKVADFYKVESIQYLTEDQFKDALSKASQYKPEKTGKVKPLKGVRGPIPQ